MKKWKKHLAAVLVLTLTLNQMVTVSAAKRDSGGTFVQNEDGTWSYEKDGELVCDDLITSDGKQYYMDVDGTMVVDEYLPIGEPGDPQMYAGTDGVVVKNGWVEMEKQCMQSNQEWHYFDKDGYEVVSEHWDEKTSESDVGMAKRLYMDGKYYAFDGDGKLLTRHSWNPYEGAGWYKIPENETADELVPEWCFAQFNGEGAKDKALFLSRGWGNGEYVKSGWVYFDSKGIASEELFPPEEMIPGASPSEASKMKIATESEIEPASSSNAGRKKVKRSGKRSAKKAPCRTIKELRLEGEESRKIKVNEKITIRWTAVLNEEDAEDIKNLTKNHDVWYETNGTIPYYKKGSFDVQLKPYENGTTFELEYTPHCAGSMGLTILADDKYHWVEIEAEAEEKTPDEAEDHVNDLINGGLDDILDKEDPVSTAVADIQNTFLIMDLSKKTAAENQAILDAWRDHYKTLLELERKFATENSTGTDKIEISKTVNEEASELFGVDEGAIGRSVKVAGLALNSRNGEAVDFTMHYTPGKENPKITEKHPDWKQADFDMNLLIAGSEAQPNVPLVIEMPVPQGFKGDELKIYHFHGDEEPYEVHVKYNSKTNTICFAVDRFSEFVLTCQEESDVENGEDEKLGEDGENGGESEKPGESDGNGGENGNTGEDGKPGENNGSSGGSLKRNRSDHAASKTKVSDIPDTPGNWKQLENGKWQFLNQGVSYANTWIYVNSRWYFIDSAGIMTEGWQFINGKTYFMVYGSGEMWTGWMSDGIYWYYMDQDGAMAVNTITPDGYAVDELGRWKER